MIDAILRRKIPREFLKTYSEELWKDVVPDVFEIGVLSLEKSFNKVFFSKAELKDIISDLKNEDYFKQKEPNKIQQLKKESNTPKIPPKTKEIDNKKQIYPDWWGGEETEEECKREIEQQVKQMKHKHKKSFQKQAEYTTSNNEEESSSYTDSCYESKNNYKELKKLTKPPVKQYEIKNRTNYKISYDKDLKPESIEKKSKDQKYSYSTGREGLQREFPPERVNAPQRNIQNENEKNNNMINSYQNQEVNPKYDYNNEVPQEINNNQFDNYQPVIPNYRKQHNRPQQQNVYQPPQMNQYINQKISNSNNTDSDIINYKSNPMSVEERANQEMNYQYNPENDIMYQQQQQSNLQRSTTSNPNEQLSMLEVDDGMKNVFREQMGYQYDKMYGNSTSSLSNYNRSTGFNKTYQIEN